MYTHIYIYIDIYVYVYIYIYIYIYICSGRGAKMLPPSIDQFGWCTWDAFYSSVNPKPSTIHPFSKPSTVSRV